MGCIHRLVEAHALHTADAPAILAPGRAPLSYGRLWAHMVDTVSALNAMGIGRNDRVAIVLPNGPELAVTLLSVIAGATAAPLNPAYQAREYDLYLSGLRAKALIVRAGMDSPVVAIARRRGVAVIELSPALGAEAGLFTLTGTALAHPAQSDLARCDDAALLLYTSGTTARAKLVPLTQANVFAGVCTWVTRELLRSDRCLNVLPLFHIQGLATVILAPLAAGSSVVCTPGFVAPRFFEWLDCFRPTWYTANPAIHQAVLEHAAQHQDVIARCPLRFVRSGSASLRPDVIAELERVLNAPVIESYGMTETVARISSNPLPPKRRKLGSVGVSAGLEIAIVDEAGKQLAANQGGEIVVRGPSVMHGCENNPEADKVAFTDGWFRTGDLGYLDGDGYLFITGRLKEVINRSGEKVSPAEVDQVLLDHPAVAQAATFAVPDAMLGEDVAAAVVLREGASATGREIRGFTAKRLAAFKVPHQVVIVEEIPTGTTGKVQRIGLAERLAAVISAEVEAEQAEYVAPRDPLEVMLAAVWSQVLDLERVGVRDDFFELGGQSLLAVSLLAAIERATGQRLPVSALFDAPTVEQLAAIVRQGGLVIAMVFVGAPPTRWFETPALLYPCLGWWCTALSRTGEPSRRGPTGLWPAGGGVRWQRGTPHARGRHGGPLPEGDPRSAT